MFLKYPIRSFFVLCCLPLAAWAQVDSMAPYRIYSVERKQEIGLDRLLMDLREADVVFFGEEHNDSVAHVLQLEVFRGLHQVKKDKLSLSMEMFQADVQLVLDEYLQGLIRETNLEQDGRLWKNYGDYRPLVEYARENGIYVLAANAPARYTNRVTRHGLESLSALSDEAKSLLAPLPIDTLTGSYYEKFATLMGGHEGMGHMKIYQSQSLWDATMAWRIAQLSKEQRGGQILHLNGRFHSDGKLGTYAHLQRYAPEIRCVNISAFSHAMLEPTDWEEWEDLGDYIIITGSSEAPGFQMRR